MRECGPDLIVSTPLVVLETAQIDLARAAVELGIRNVFAVASWDHLSSKGELNFMPQCILLWNEIQKREAMELHHIGSRRIVVTGAQVFDDWFDETAFHNTRGNSARVSDCPLIGRFCCTSAPDSWKEAHPKWTSCYGGRDTCARAGIPFCATAVS